MPHQQKFNKLDSVIKLFKTLSMISFVCLPVIFFLFVSFVLLKLNNCWWIEKLIGFRFIIRWRRTGNFKCLIIFNDYLIVTSGILMECTLTHAKFLKNTHTKTIQTIDQYMDDKYTEYTCQTNNYRLSRFSPIEQPINWFWFCPEDREREKKKLRKMLNIFGMVKESDWIKITVLFRQQ